MATVEPQVANSAPNVELPRGWKRRLEDPLNTYYRYPVAAGITKLLIRTPVTPNQVSLVQPLISAFAGYLITFDDWRYHMTAALVFEFRSILDCVDGSLARAKKIASPNGHAVDAIADWLGVVFLFIGIMHYVVHHPAAGYSSMLSFWIVGLALAQGALRSISHDFFKSKYIGIYERRRDEVTEQLLMKRRSWWGRVETFILRTQHLFFQFQGFDARRSRPLPASAIERMVSEEDSPRTRFVGFLWSVSSGDAFLSFVIVSILIGKLWAGQLFFATFGTAWIFAVIAYNVAFIRRYQQPER
ncbi:MAG: CDP-alcohol phosphatidyltransferase family protein [Polyangiaceae bacterium]